MQRHDYSELTQALAALVTEGEVFEVRILYSGRKRVDAGYFDSIPEAATAICALTEPYMGLYITPNPVKRDLLARAANRIASWSQYTTMDHDILERRWILLDVDYERPSGISATDTELETAFTIAKRIANAMELEGWPRPVFNASGNGCHLMYPCKEPNNELVRDTLATFLKAIDARFKDRGVKIDVMNFNAARIWRLPGTWAAKGDNIPERPHRKAYIIQLPEPRRVVTLKQLMKFNDAYEYLIPDPRGTRSNKSSIHKVEYPQDERKYKGLNDQAMARMGEWVPVFFPDAREYKQGYRVSSDDLGLDHEEDLTLHPWPLGIKYFGVADQGDETEGRRTPISTLAEFLFKGDKDLAARRLADTLKAPLNEFAAEPMGQAMAAAPHVAGKLPGISSTRPVYDFSRIPSMATLQQRIFAKQKWIIEDVLPTGNIMLVSRPKMRKTFLALQLAIAIAGGRKFLNWQCAQGDILFLGLEDNERRLRSRIKLLQKFDLNPPDLSGFRYWTGGVDIRPNGQHFISDPEEAARTYAAFPRGEAGVEALDKFLDTFPKTRMIVIDTYAHFREQSNNRDVYQRDVDQMMPLTLLASRREILVLVVHHEKKGLASQESGDFMEDISGTSGITGAVDGIMSIKGKRGATEHNEQRKLLLSGRDIPRDFDIDMAFDAERGGWLPAARQDVQAQILALLAVHPFISQQEFKTLLSNTSPSMISKTLIQLKYEGLVHQGKYGYALPRMKGELLQ